MTAIPDDILAVAAVVTGGQSAALAGWQQAAAVTAMAALGYSRDHVAWALKVVPQHATGLARKYGVTLPLHDQRYDPVAVEAVCQGTPMRLLGADRDEAIRRLGPTKTAKEIALLTGWSQCAISARASDLGVSTTPRTVWTYSGRPARKRQTQAA